MATIDVWPASGTVTLESGAVITSVGAEVLVTNEIQRLLRSRVLLTSDPSGESADPSPLPGGGGGGGSGVGDATTYVVPAGGFGVAADGSTDDYTALHTLCNVTVSADGGTVTLQGPYTYRISTNLTIPSNVTLRILHGAVIKPDAGVTLTVNGPVEAPCVRCFDTTQGLSVVSYIRLPGKTVYPEWFGAKNDSGATDNHAAIMAAFEALKGANGTIEFSGTQGYYGLSKGVGLIPSDGSAANILGEVTIKGQGWGTQIKHTLEYAFGADYGADLAIFRVQGHVNQYVKHLHVRDIRISGYSSADHIQCFRLGFVNKAHFERVYIDSTANEGITSVSTDACNVFLIDHCYAENVGRNTQNVAAYNTNANWTMVTNCTAIGCGQGVEHTGRGAIFSNNTFERCLANGLLVASSTYHSEEILVTGNRLFRCPVAITTASQTDSLGKMIIANNVISFCDTGVTVVSGNNNGAIIEGNYFYGGESTVGAAVVLATGRHTVRGNEFVYLTGTHTLSTTNGSVTATGNRGSGITDGMYVTIAGVTGEKRVESMVWSISTGIVCTLSSACDATVTGASCTYHSGKWAYYINVTTDDYHIIEGNTFRGEGWTTLCISLKGLRATVKDNLWDNGGVAWSAFLVGIGGSLASLRGVHTNNPSSLIYGPSERSQLQIAGDPPALTWKVGDVTYDPAPTAGGTVGRVCVTAGTAGTIPFAATGSITSGSTTLTLSSSGSLYIGAYITIAGVTGTKRIANLSGTTATLDSAANATVSGAAIAFSAPVWKTFGSITA